MNLLAQCLVGSAPDAPQDAAVSGFLLAGRSMVPTVLVGRVTTTGARPDVGVRAVERADLLDVFDIEKRSFAQPWPYAAFERLLDAPAFFVAEVDGDVVGYVVADTVPNHGPSIGHVKDIAVHPEHRGEGVGRTLLSRALMDLFVEGAGRVKLEVRESNERAQRLYADFEFEVHHVVSGYYEDGEDAYVMVREA
jgi:ribosomal-protein-alanine N-acetyltransferase